MNIHHLPKEADLLFFDKVRPWACSKRFLEFIIAIVLFHIVACGLIVHYSFKEAIKTKPTKLHVKTVSLNSERLLPQEIRKEEVAKVVKEEEYVAVIPESTQEAVTEAPEVSKKDVRPKPPEVKKTIPVKEAAKTAESPPKPTKKKEVIKPKPEVKKTVPEKVPPKKIKTPPKPKKSTEAATKQSVEKKSPKPKESSLDENKVQKSDQAKLQVAKENERRKTLIAQALTNLGDAHIAKGSSAQIAATIPIATLAALHTDSIIIEDAKENAFSNPSERSYYDELVSRLQLGLKLPEYGSVKIKLTVTKEGKVVAVHICETKSQKNSAYVEKKMKTLSFPPFGVNFQNEKEHTFYLNLSNG